MLKHKYRIVERRGKSTNKSVYFIQRKFLGLRFLPFLYIRDKHTRKRIPLEDFTKAASVAKRLAEPKQTIYHPIKV